MQCKQIQHTGMGLLVQGIKCLADGSTYLGNVEFYQLTVPFNDSIHKKIPRCLMVLSRARGPDACKIEAIRKYHTMRGKSIYGERNS